MTRPTVFGISCPWSGNDNDPIPPSYWAWYRLYRLARRVRHFVGLHDWKWRGVLLEREWQYCDWCGARR